MNQEGFSELDSQWLVLWDFYKDKKDNLPRLEKKIGYEFSNIHFLYEAFTHRSALVGLNIERGRKELSPLDLPWNERIEFLGDSVLGLIISSLLWRKENELYSEGELSRLRAYLVSETRLSQIASEISLEDYILIAKVEEKKGGLKRESLLADCFEALVVCFSDTSIISFASGISGKLVKLISFLL